MLSMQVSHKCADGHAANYIDCPVCAKYADHAYYAGLDDRANHSSLADCRDTLTMTNIVPTGKAVGITLRMEDS